MKKKNYLTLLLISLSTFTINVLAQGDSNPPVLNSISINSENVKAGEDISFTLNVTDDLSGLNHAYLSIKNPSGGQEQNFIGGLFSEKWNDLGGNKYSTTIKLNEFAVSGQWYVESVSIVDNANNRLSKYSFNETILTFNVTNENNIEDSTPPVLNSISINSENVKAGEDITFILNITDDISGLNHAYLSIKNPNGGQEQNFIGGLFSEKWNNLGENNYSTTIKLSEFAISGQWYVESVSIVDNSNNRLSKYSFNETILEFHVGNTPTNIETTNLLGNISIIKKASNTFSINSAIDIIDYEIYALNGRKLNVEKSDLSLINLGSAEHGIYIVKIRTSKGHISKKIIK